MSKADDALETKFFPHDLQLLQPQSLAQHPAAVYLSQLRPKSRQTMGRNLDLIANLLTQGQCDRLTLDWSQLRYYHTAAIRAVLVEKFAPSTVNQMLCALRRVLKEAKKLKLMSPSDYTDAVDIENVRFTKELRGRALKPAEIAAILQVMKTDLTAAGRRDSALFIILLGSGVRRQEVVSIDLSDFDPSSGAIKVRGGKGGKDRTVYLPSSGMKAVSAWLKVRGVKAGPLLYPVSKGHRVMERRLTDQSVLYILQKRAKQSGVDSFSPHDCRRTFISNLLDAGADLVTVSQLAGHANPMTTAKYDRRGEAAKRQATELLHIPYDE
ncbi:tyrosine-type recombinase/integrase [Chlorogloea sp. CCALA 695]|uniref:tyrosine-type recombinase/integrase n=1 Tax=Chlorogloea sp. CCALA 695 TaxID=2107693 RepID=UPI000D06D4A1|nr:site-specific integrase [Chlorogloea sp. CCALA 695]PSB31355.1 integrase [Chlorogloea sp. CCALA 695]